MKSTLWERMNQSTGINVYHKDGTVTHHGGEAEKKRPEAETKKEKDTDHIEEV